MSSGRHGDDGGVGGGVRHGDDGGHGGADGDRGVAEHMLVDSVSVILPPPLAMLNPASFPRQKRCWLTMWCHPWLSW